MHYSELDEVWRELTAPGAAFEMTHGGGCRTYRHAPADLREMWLATAAFGDRDYLIYEDERISYREAHRQVANLAAWLAAQGVGPGDRVALAMRNYPEWLLSCWAVTCVGAVAVCFNAWWTGSELAYGLEDAQPKVLIADGERIERLSGYSEALASVRLVATRHDGLCDRAIPWSQTAGHAGVLPDAAIDPTADALILYTSGTTGKPKGARLTHAGCANNLMNLLFAGRSQVLAMQRAKKLPIEAGPPPVPAALVTTPLFHVTALTCVAHPTTHLGGKLVLMRRWDPTAALELVERERVTSLSAVPTIARELVAHPEFSRFDTSSLGSLGGGGAPLHPDLLTRIERVATSARAQTGYGMTEVCGAITSIIGDFFLDKPTSCGRPLPTYDLEIRDEDGRPLPAGATGEVWARGCTIIAGYLNTPEGATGAIVDGWLRTGDIGRLDPQGFLHLVDRKKDMVLRGGENVYCAEVEAALYAHPSVHEGCVFAIPDARLGEAVAAAVRLRPGESASERDLQDHCATLIARHKIPTRIWLLREPLPRNASGKILKSEIRLRLISIGGAATVARSGAALSPDGGEQVGLAAT
jgi:long-chain acyl-CoA synthetase